MAQIRCTVKIRNASVKGVIIGGVVLVLLILFNPRIEAHKEAIELPFDTAWNAYSRSANWFDKFGLWVGGDAARSAFRSDYLNLLDRKNCAIFSLGYINGKLVTLGILGYVHVFELSEIGTETWRIPQ